MENRGEKSHKIIKMGIKTSDEMQSLLNARGHFSLRAPFLGLEDAQALINILQEPDSTAASGGEYQH